MGSAKRSRGYPRGSTPSLRALERLSGLLGRSLCHWDAAREARREPKGVATRPEWPRGRFQEASGTLRKAFGVDLGTDFLLKIAFGGRPAQRPLRGAFLALFRVDFRWHAQAPTCVLYCNLQYILGVAPSSEEVHRDGRGASKITEKSSENQHKIEKIRSRRLRNRCQTKR